jgi:hydroxymethylbilane synthase
LRVATRGSPLARWQAERVMQHIAAVPGAPPTEMVVVETTGDLRTDVPLHRIGGQGVFVKEVQRAVLDGRADLAVHSAKDLPGGPTPGLVLAAAPERGDRRDALVGARLEELAVGATVATGSVRRRAQLAWLRPDLTFVELRGNMASRVHRARQVGAGIVAVAALERLGLGGEVAEVLDESTLLPQVGQGTIAVECRVDDDRGVELLAGVDDPRAHVELRAERAFLEQLGAGCTLPVAASARYLGAADAAAAAETRGDDPEHAPEVAIVGMLASRDGAVVLRRRARGRDPEAVGASLATDLVDGGGGRSLGDWANPEPVGDR